MKIVVCVKQIVHPKIPMGFDLYAGSVPEENLVYTIKPSDLCALEQALRLKEEHGAEVEVISIASDNADINLREYLAMGANNVTRLWDSMFQNCSEYDKAVVLSKAASKLEYDLILCGSGTSELGSGVVPAAMAELLNIAYVGQVTSIGLAKYPTQLGVEQKLEKGNRQEVLCETPAVLAVEEVIEPRYSTLANLLEALEKPISVWSADDIGISRTELEGSGKKSKLLSLSIPKPRARKVILPDATASPTDRLQFLISGGAAAKKDNILEGQPEMMVEKLLSILKDKGFLGEAAAETNSPPGREA